MAKTELLAVILRPAAENSPSAYRHLEAFIKEISAEIKFNKSDTRVVNLFKNINTKSNRAFGIAFEEISTVVGQYSHSFKSEVNEEGNTISIGSGVGSVVDFFSHCIHGLFFLWLHKIPEKDHPVLKSFAADANLKCQQCLFTAYQISYLLVHEPYLQQTITTQGIKQDGTLLPGLTLL
ncbi:hypothetical protein BY996DRAFT_6417574 [Phakopsora pachyrhizi]|nr:hypothetical protein BY996DRAFT_6417574 [Phakopsora pachyrhizi]